MKLHPYALIFGLGIGVMVLAALRHPLFAVLSAIAAIILIDMGLKGRDSDDADQ